MMIKWFQKSGFDGGIIILYLYAPVERNQAVRTVERNEHRIYFLMQMGKKHRIESKEKKDGRTKSSNELNEREKIVRK